MWGARAGVQVAAVAVVALAAVAGSASTTAAVSRDAGEVGYTAPVQPLRVVRPFTAPVTRYGPGHLGVDLEVGAGAQVHPAAAGVIRFAGPVAGRGLVVVLHADGVSTEYEPLTVLVHAGDAVTTATVLGRVHGRHGSGPCRPDRCLHWGAQRAGEHLDPLLLLRPLGVVRLLPWP